MSIVSDTIHDSRTGTLDAGWSAARVEPSQLERQSAMHLEALRSIGLRISGERDVHGVLRCIVEGLSQQPHVALARVWIIAPGDICSSGRMRASCPNQASCLHLAASAGANPTTLASRLRALKIATPKPR